MTLDELKKKLASDPVARLKYIGSAIEFYEHNGVTVTPELIKNFDNEAITAVTKGGGGGTNIIAIFAV